ncbi:MAG: acyl-CoA dehydrogenase family protein [Mycobacteriales bacterium]
MNPSFDAYRLSDEHVMLRDTVRQLASDKIAPRAAEIDATAEFPWDVYDALVKADLHATHVPEEYGGMGADSIATCLVIEEIAKVCASSSLIPGVNKLATVPLLLAASPELQREVMEPMARGEAMASYALSEREAGSDTASMKSRAVRDGDDWVLTGTKCWITGASVSTYFTVMAKTDPEAGARGVSAFVVHKDDPGFSVGTHERKLGIKGSPTCEIYLENCRIPGHRIIGELGSGLKTAFRTLDHTRLTIGAQAVGIAQGAIDAALAYTQERQQFGQPVSDFQGVQFMLADMAMNVEAARQLMYAAAAKAERGDKDLTFISAAAKCFASDVAMSVTTDAVQLFGGYGYTKDFPVERMMRDAKITQIYEGTNQIQRLVMARQLLRR